MLFPFLYHCTVSTVLSYQKYLGTKGDRIAFWGIHFLTLTLALCPLRFALCSLPTKSVYTNPIPAAAKPAHEPPLVFSNEPFSISSKMASVGCPSLIKAGSPCIHMSWIVPADKEAEVDAFWKRHEKWMRETHTIGVVYPEDEAKPKLLHYYISKGPQMKDPMKPEEGTTGNFVYQMAESYVSDEDLKNHLKVGVVFLSTFSPPPAPLSS